MLVHCNEPLCVLCKHTQSPTLITEEEMGYSVSPQLEHWMERGICKFFHPLMTYNLLWRWVFCLRVVIDMSSIMMEWVWEKCHSQEGGWSGSQAEPWAVSCLAILFAMWTSVCQTDERSTTSCTVCTASPHFLWFIKLPLYWWYHNYIYTIFKHWINMFLIKNIIYNFYHKKH